MIKKILIKIIKFIFPNRCLFCNKIINEDEIFCDKCYSDIPYIDGVTCLKCGRPLYEEKGYLVCPGCNKHKMNFEANYPCFIYEGKMKEALLKFKFSDEMWYHKALGNLMCERIGKENLIIDYIVYPAINNKTFYKRGYNQSELLSKIVGKRLGITVIKNAILKVNQNKKQSLMSRSERWKNIKGVFKVNNKYEELLKGKNILIIDDVYTTGATLNECACILKKKGVKRVYGLTLCIVK